MFKQDPETCNIQNVQDRIQNYSAYEELENLHFPKTNLEMNGTIEHLRKKKKNQIEILQLKNAKAKMFLKLTRWTQYYSMVQNKYLKK